MALRLETQIRERSVREENRQGLRAVGTAEVTRRGESDGAGPGQGRKPLGTAGTGEVGDAQLEQVSRRESQED